MSAAESGGPVDEQVVPEGKASIETSAAELGGPVDEQAVPEGGD